MARGRTKTVTTEERVLDPEEIDPEPSHEEIEAQDIEELAASLDLGDSGAVKIFRKVKGDLKRPAYVETIPIESFKSEGLEGIKSKYGGGDYHIQFCQRGKVIRAQSVSIDARFKGTMDQAPQPAGDTPALTMLVEKLTAKESSSGNTELLLGMMQMIQQSSENSLKVMTSAMQSVTAAVQASQPKQQTGVSLADVGKVLIPLMPIFRDLIARRADPAGGWKEMISAMRSTQALIGNGKTDVEEREQPGILERLLELAAPALLGASPPFGSQAQGAASPVGASPEPAQTQIAEDGHDLSAAPDAPASPPENPNDPIMLRMLVIRGIREQYPKLLKAAVKGSDAASYFEVIADEFEDTNPAALDVLVKILQEPNWCETLFGAKEIPQQAWFDALRHEFISAYVGEPVPVDTK